MEIATAFAFSLMAYPLVIAVAAHDKPAQKVSIREVDDYAPGHYKGRLTPSPPHADMNAKRAVIVTWSGRSERLVFSHEASYCPLLELPSGAGMCDQFF